MFHKSVSDVESQIIRTTCHNHEAVAAKRGAAPTTSAGRQKQDRHNRQSLPALPGPADTQNRREAQRDPVTPQEARGPTRSGIPLQNQHRDDLGHAAVTGKEQALWRASKRQRGAGLRLSDRRRPGESLLPPARTYGSNRCASRLLYCGSRIGANLMRLI